MSATELPMECRRRLPTAPASNLNRGVSVSGEVRRRIMSMAMEFTQSQTMDTRPKKRLTPEVVATLLSMDLGTDVQTSKTATPVVQGAEMSNLLTSREAGMVEIVKSRGQPLGFSLREGNSSNGEKPGGIFVSRLTAGGVVEQNSLLYAGDEILEVNYVPVHGYKLSDVVAMIQLPKRLVLKVRFQENQHQNSGRTEREFKKKPINNNYIYDDGKTRCTDNKRTGARESGTRLDQRQMGTYGQIGTSTEDVPALESRNFTSRRTSESGSGRILPAPPESEEIKTRSPHGFEDSSNSRLSKPNRSNISTEVLCSGSSHAKDTNLMSLNQKAESSTVCAAKYKNRRRSAVLPVGSTNEKTPTSQIVGKPGEGCPGIADNVRGKRVDPADIRFDIVPTNGASFGTAVISHTLEEVQAERNRDCTMTSSPVAFRSPKNSTLQTFDSNSSLSSSDSPKIPYRGLSARSSVDASPESSSAETEEQTSNNTSSSGTKQQKPPLLLHSFLSGELIPSTNNNWFSKIGNQTRKHVRKISEVTPLRAPKDGEAYRLQEHTDVTNDDVDPGYRPYPDSSSGGRNENKDSLRAVTGMLALCIVKGCNISPREAASKDKRKKIKVFCAVDCDGIRQACTGIKKGLNNFQWNESFEIIFQRTREINITVCVRSKKEGDRTLSQGCLCLAQLLSEGAGEHMLAVSLDPVGTLYVRLQFTDMKLLLQRTPSQRKEGVFGFSLDTVLRRENSRIPVLVRKCVDEINRRGLDVTGIYRLCGNAAKKRALRAEFENNSAANVDLGRSENLVDVNVITGLLKDYLRELPNPLLSEEVREILYEASGRLTHDESSERLLVDKITKTFPSTSKDTIACLLDHFATVLMHSDVNKMNSHNLAVCIGPVLLCPSLGATSNDTVSDAKKDISAIKLLLEIWPKPEQVSAC